MARQKRYHIPGSSYHVMLRGNDGQDIFFYDEDRCNMCFLLQEGTERYGHQIHAFCFMKNHVHLLMQVGETSLSKIIQNLAFRYTQRINCKYERIGHLFQGRFKAILIDESAYFMRLLRYIHMNPVRANIVKDPEKYMWSSHNAYLGGSEIAWLTTDYGLSKFGKNRGEARLMYSEYVLKKESQQEIDELRKRFKDGQVLGDDDFLNRVREKSENHIDDNLSLNAILKGVCQILKLSEEDVLCSGKYQKASFARGAISMIARDTGKISIEEIASLMCRDASTISSLLSRFYTKYSNSTQIQKLIEEAKIKAKQIAELQA
jgi:putative transposase